MHGMSTSANASKSYIRGWVAHVYRDDHGRNTQLRLRELGVKNAHLQFPHTRANRNFNPVPVQAPYVWCPSRSIVYGVGVREWCERSKPTF